MSDTTVRCPECGNNTFDGTTRSKEGGKWFCPKCATFSLVRDWCDPHPHADGDYSYLCGNPHCRCLQ